MSGRASALGAGVRAIAPPFLYAVLALVLEVVMQSTHTLMAFNYGLLAKAWLNGHAWISFIGPSIDAVPFQARAYIVEAPAPAVLLLPLVPFFGPEDSQRILASALGAVTVFVVADFAARRGLSGFATFAVVAFAFFGTSLYTCATLGDVWFLAHVAAFCSTILAIGECLGKRRPWLVAIYAVFAAFSRYSLFCALPLYAIELFAERGLRDLGRYLATLVPFFALAGWYDYVRWGTLGDPGFAIWYALMDDRYKAGIPMFGLSNVQTQLGQFVYTYPQLRATYPWIVVDDHGFSILWTSFPFVYAVFARLGRFTMLLWTGAIATAIPAFTYYDTGQYQFGMRHALDFEPFLLVLLVLALARRPSRIAVFACLAFALFGAYEGTVWLRA